MAAALGTVFLNEKGIGFIPTGDTLEKVSQIDNRGTERFLKGVEIKAMCDINNPMYGKKGAAYIFGPQKGAGPREVQVLDRNLRTFSRTIESALGRDVSSLPGSGAAGAMGAGVSVFLGGSLVSGIDLLLDTVNFDELLEGCDAVFTGEGKLDSQSFGGKVIAGVAKHARTRRIPVFIIAGSMEPNLNRQLHKWGVCKAAPVYEAAPNIEAILATCRQDLSKKAAELCQEMADSGF